MFVSAVQILHCCFFFLVLFDITKSLFKFFFTAVFQFVSYLLQFFISVIFKFLKQFFVSFIFKFCIKKQQRLSYVGETLIAAL